MRHQLRTDHCVALALGSGLRTPEANAAETTSDADTALETIVITGSLLPHRGGDQTSPVLTITSQDMQSKGFRIIAEALQHTSFATGAVAGPGQVGSYAPGAQVVSLFGLSPAYTKYLIDGRPMADYPALYVGTDVIESLSGIPEAFRAPMPSWSAFLAINNLFNTMPPVDYSYSGRDDSAYNPLVYNV
jgi:outer membrane receptor for ferrienterochelin and colicin